MTTAVQLAQSVAPGVSLGFKNRIINGAMTIDQRNAGASVTAGTSNAYTLDRWQTLSVANSKYTIQQNAGSVTPPAGFTNYLGITSSAATTISSSDYYWLVQTIEGFNTADLGFGTANASSVTISFWVRSSLTGTFGGGLTNSSGAAVASSRCYPFTYTISAANTWEYKTVTISGDTSGSWNGATNGIGLALIFNLGTGSNYTATAGSWTGTASKYSASGVTNTLATNGATFYITGVQLEVGTAATSFEFRDYGRELIMCQRYLPCLRATAQYSSAGFIGTCSGSSTGYTTWNLPVRTRVPATGLVASSNLFYCDGVAIAGSVSSQALSTAAAVPQTTVDMIALTVGISGATSGRVLFLEFNASTDYIYFTGCEL